MIHDRLEDYAVKGLNLGLISGVSLAAHALADGFLLLHTGVGCKYKAAAQIAQHDWLQHPNRREGWTEVGDLELIKGAAGRLGPYLRTWSARRRPGLVLVVAASFLRMSGEDIAAEIGRAAEGLEAPVAFIEADRFTGGFFSGYARAMEAVFSRVDFSVPVRPGLVGLVGNFFSRYEMDQQANLQQLAFLLKGLGLTPGPILFSGRPVAKLGQLGACEHLVALPYVTPVADRLASHSQRPLSSCHLPIGLLGTRRWLERVAGAVGGGARHRLPEFLDAQLKHAGRQIAPARERISGMRVAVFAETPLAAGLVGLLTELGAQVVLVGLRETADLGGREDFIELLKNHLELLDEEMEILEAPALLTTRHKISELAVAGRLDCVLGSSHELNLLRYLPDEVLLHQFGGQSGSLLGLEIGFPTYRYHAQHADPLYGFGGAVAVAQRLVQAMQYYRIAR